MARPPLAVPLLALAGFLALLGLVLGNWAPLHSFDVAVIDAFRAYGQTHPGVVAVLRVVTDVATTGPFVAAGLLAALVLLVRREWPAAALCVIVIAGVPVLWSLTKWLLHQPRPQGGFVLATGNGFPSGHTSNAAAAALLAVLLLWPRVTRTARVITVALAVLFAIFIGATRVALLAHWPTDVLGGWLLALAAVPLAAHAVSHLPGGAASSLAKGPSGRGERSRRDQGDAGAQQGVPLVD
jgi:undecaprenyl-diphosphatase